MAGINASSSSKSHTNTGEDVAVSGFIAGEVIELTDSISGTDYLWTVALPSGSSAARVGFAGEDESSASFTPDVSGTYTVSVVIDGVTHHLRIGVARLAFTNAVEGVRLTPVTDSQVPTPATGLTEFCGADHGNVLCVKDANGDVFTVDVTAVP